MTLPAWFFDEAAHAGGEHLDPAYVATYDRKAATDPLEDLALLQARGLNESHTLVDLGAGTGTFALAAAPLCRRVIAVDVSPDMLAVLAEKRSHAALTNLEIIRAGFLSYDHRGEPVDVVYSRHALHHLPDFWKALALVRIAAILKPGGVLFLRDLVYAFEPRQIEQAIESWVAGGAPDASLGWTRAELETHVREEFSTFSWLLEPMLERAGFTIEGIQRHGSSYAAYTCIKTG